MQLKHKIELKTQLQKHNHIHKNSKNVGFISPQNKNHSSSNANNKKISKVKVTKREVNRVSSLVILFICLDLGINARGHLIRDNSCIRVCLESICKKGLHNCIKPPGPWRNRAVSGSSLFVRDCPFSLAFPFSNIK